MSSLQAEKILDGPVAYLHPGRVLTSSQGIRIVTILGSCVAVGMWDASVGIGGMIHFVLPRAPKNGNADRSRYGDSGIPLMVERLCALGVRPEDVRAKVFGGAGVLRGDDHNVGRLGMENVEMALRYLLDARIPIVAIETGGERGRKVQFDTRDGCAWVKQVQG